MAIRIPPKTKLDSTQSTNALTAAVSTSAPATPTTNGTVKQGVAVADATDEASAVTQLNALFASLRASGAIAT